MADIRQVRTSSHFPEENDRLKNVIAWRAPALAPFAFNVGAAVIGADLLQRHGVPAAVVHAVRAHHYDEEPHSLEALLLIAADAISAARPGARRESLEAYVKRLEKLEEIANSFQGVQQSYAIQAGREVRILVKPEQIDDTAAQLMVRDIAKRIETELSFPGQIRVTVVRETRAIEYAK